MTSANSSFLGIASQVAKGTPNVTDASFKYLLFNQGGVAPQNIVIPTDTEVGGGAMIRDAKKMGVSSGGAIEFIPRPDSLGWFLFGATGNVTQAQAYAEDAIMGKTLLAVGAQPTNLPGPGYLPHLPLMVYATGYMAGATLTGTITITGTVGGTPGTTDTIALSGNTTVAGTKVFQAISNISLPAQVTAGDMVSIGVKATSASTMRHRFSLGADQFAAPYFTVRSAPGNMWGEQFQDVRVSGVSLEFKGANFVRSTVSLTGGLPAKVSTGTWSALTQVDSGPPMITPLANIELPTGTAVKVLSGSFSAGMSIPMDEQWIVGSYSPDDFQITQRVYAVSFQVKIADATLYSKMMYDPAGGSSWAASLFREANFKLDFLSDITMETGFPYGLSIRGNGQTGTNSNIVWSASPVGMRAGKQIVMNVSGMFLADPTAAIKPIDMQLFNQHVLYS